MAFIRNKTHASLAATAGSITGTMPSYETGDLLFAYAICDGNRLVTVDGAWTVLEQGNSLGTVGYSVAYIENATGSETAPVFSLSSNDTASVVMLAIGGVSASSTIEASTTPFQLTATRSESPFTGVTTLTDNALVLHLFGNTGVGGCATDQGLLKVSDEIGYVGESAYILEETLPTAGASSSGNMLQFGTMANFYMSLSIADGSSGSEIKPQQIGGGMELINALQGAETQTWLIGGNNTLTTPSDVATPADYGTILGKTFRTVETAADLQDANTNPFLAAARFRVDRGAFYSGIRFGMDTQGTGGSIDMTGKALMATVHMNSLNLAVKVQTKDAIGLGIVLESGSDDYNNYIAHTVSGSDASSPKVSPLNGPCVINYDYGSEIASSGTFDETDLLKVSFIGASLNTANLNMQICNIGLLSSFEIVGGSSSLPVNQNYLYEVGYANFAYLIQNTGDLILSYAPWKFGNGVIDTYVDFAGKTFSFPEQGADTGALVNDTFLGLTFDSTLGSNINCEGITLASPTPFYLDVVNTLGTINFRNSIISNSQTCNLRGDFTGASFTPKTGTVVDDFDAIIDDITVNGDLRLNTERDLSGVTATKVVFTQGGNYSFSGCDILEVENISGSLVTITSDSLILNKTETNGTLFILDSFLSFGGIDSWIVYSNSTDQDANTNALGSGTSENYLFSYSVGVTYYMRLNVSGEVLLKSVTPIVAGETEVDLGTSSLLVSIGATTNSINTQLGYIARVVYCDIRSATNGDGSNSNPFNSIDFAITEFNTGGYSHIDLKTAIDVPAVPSLSLEGLRVIGSNPTAHLIISNLDCSSAEFDHILIQGVQGTSTVQATFNHCKIVGNFTNLFANIENNCQILSLTGTSVTVGFIGASAIIDCKITNVGDTTISVSNNASLAIRNITGKFTLSGIQGSSVVSIDSFSGDLTLDSSCSGGSVRIYDTIKINDNSTGTVKFIEDLPTLTQMIDGGISTFDSTADQVIVSTNNDKTGYILDNNSITSSTIANNAFNNSAFTTGYYNSINAEVDSALSDYDAPTKAELDIAEANIVAEINANETLINSIISSLGSLNDPTKEEIRDALLLVKDEFKADLTSLSVPQVSDIVSGLQAVSDDFKDMDTDDLKNHITAMNFAS